MKKTIIIVISLLLLISFTKSCISGSKPYSAEDLIKLPIDDYYLTKFSYPLTLSCSKYKFFITDNSGDIVSKFPIAQYDDYGKMEPMLIFEVKGNSILMYHKNGDFEFNTNSSFSKFKNLEFQFINIDVNEWLLKRKEIAKFDRKLSVIYFCPNSPQRPSYRLIFSSISDNEKFFKNNGIKVRKGKDTEKYGYLFVKRNGKRFVKGHLTAYELRHKCWDFFNEP